MFSKRERKAFRYGNYEVFAYGTYRPGQRRWLANVSIRRKNGTLAEQNFHDHSVEFESNLAAELFASEYAKRLIDGSEPGLTI